MGKVDKMIHNEDVIILNNSTFFMMTLSEQKTVQQIFRYNISFNSLEEPILVFEINLSDMEIYKFSVDTEAKRMMIFSQLKAKRNEKKYHLTFLDIERLKVIHEM